MDFKRTAPAPCRVPVVLLCLLLAAGCSFSEGPDWPPAVELEPAVPESPTAALPPSAARPSLAALLDGEAAPAPPGGGANLVGLIRPLVVIRFPDAAPVDYEEPLYQAVSEALKRRPQTGFDLVAVSDGLRPGDQVTARAQAVLRSLSEMGLPPERLSLSAASLSGVTGSEVHLYVR